MNSIASLNPDEITHVTDRFCRDFGERYRGNLEQFYHWLHIWHTDPPESYQSPYGPRIINDARYPDQDWSAMRSGLLSDALVCIRKYQMDYRLRQEA